MGNVESSHNSGRVSRHSHFHHEPSQKSKILPKKSLSKVKLIPDNIKPKSHGKKKSFVQKSEPHLKNIGATLLISRNVVRLAGRTIKELRGTLLFNGIFIPMDLWAIKKKVCKMTKENRKEVGMAVGVKFSGLLKNTADFISGLSISGVGGEQLVLASNALMGVGVALSVLAIIVNVKSYYKTKKTLEEIEKNENTVDIVADLKIKDPKTVEKINKLWKVKKPGEVFTKAQTKLQKIVKSRYSQKIKSIRLAILICVVSIVAVSLILAAVATPVGWGLLVSLGTMAIFKYCYDKHAYYKFKERVSKLEEPETVEAPDITKPITET